MTFGIAGLHALISGTDNYHIRRQKLGTVEQLRIVFVHFGRKAPKHLVLNLKRCNVLFPEIKIVLITNESCKIKNINGVERINFIPNSNWHEIESGLSHPKEFRDNFWVTSLTRFVAIEDYQKDNNFEILHVESDVILSPDFPFAKFSTLKKPSAFSIISPSLGIASIVYIRNHATSNKLIKVILSEVKKNSSTSDMLILKKFYDLYPDLVHLLPIGPNNLDSYRKNLKEEMFTSLTHELSNFGGIFDAADIGHYLFGEDPRNHRGLLFLRKMQKDNYLDLGKVSVKYSGLRNFGDLSFESMQIPIFCLHVHCKDKKVFANKSSQRVLAKAIDSFHKPPKVEFIFRVFLKSVVLSLRRRLNSLLLAANRLT